MRPWTSVVRRIAWSPLIGSGRRIASGSGSDGDEAPRVGLAEPGADEDVLDERGGAAARARDARRPSGAAASSSARGRGRPRDLLDDVDLARHVACAPGRHRHVPVVRRPRSRAARGSPRCSAGATSMPTTRSVRSGRSRTTGRGRQAGVDVGAAASARRPRGRRAGGLRARPRAPRGRDRRPSPSGSSLPSADRGAPTCAGRRSARSSPPRAAPRSSRRPPRSRARP